MFAFISHPDCLKHDAGPGHPDTPERLHAINNALLTSGLDFVIRHYDAPLVEREALDRVHTRAYLDSLYALDTSKGPVRLDDDTILSPGTLRAAERSAGAGVLGVELIMKGEASGAFCGIRPPGHHAEAGGAMGFCYFNNIAVAAAHALAVHGLERVAIVDFDVHHGNGTEAIFRNEPRVLFCSSFQHPFYPFTGDEKQTENLIDVPLPAGTGSKVFRKAISERWLPALDAFKPQFLFVSAGFDGHIADEMAHFALVEADYEWLTERLMGIARGHCDGRILSMLEGGYEPGALARSVVRHIKAML